MCLITNFLIYKDIYLQNHLKVKLDPLLSSVFVKMFMMFSMNLLSVLFVGLSVPCQTSLITNFLNTPYVSAL